MFAAAGVTLVYYYYGFTVLLYFSFHSLFSIAFIINSLILWTTLYILHFVKYLHPCLKKAPSGLPNFLTKSCHKKVKKSPKCVWPPNELSLLIQQVAQNVATDNFFAANSIKK